MRRHGWGGAPPEDESEARRRILDATARCVDREGAMQASLSDVATELGVTRQTVYRYFPSTEALFSELAQSSADDFIDRIAARMAPHDDPAEAMVEGLAFTIESVPQERYIGLALRTGDVFTQGIISEVSMDFGRSMLQRSHVDWDALIPVEQERDDFIELLLRLIQSLSLTPVAPTGQPRTGDSLRSFLRRWLAPVIPSPARP